MVTTKTYTFVNSQPADATQVNKNFDDLLAGINADVSATDKVLGRATAGAGPVEEIPCTAAGRALIDDANAAAQLTTLGALPIAGGTMTGVLAGQANTSYTTFQVRNVTESTADASGGSNGDIWIKYLA